MITLQTLENITIEQLVEVFNLSFSDYMISMTITDAQLADKIKAEDIKMELSVGAFENGQLIGFMLHGHKVVEGEEVVYNAGTGVIPNKRGNKLTVEMYAYLLPILHKKRIAKIQLEVITTNAPALRTYTNLGFEIVRELNCYKGLLQPIKKIVTVEIRKLETYDWQKLQSFWDFEPSWQNSITAVENLKYTNISLGMFRDHELLGYIIYNPALKRIQQLAIERAERNQGFGKLLMEYIATTFNKEISIINIENGSTLDKFMKKGELKLFIKQYEMEISLKSSVKNIDNC